ncbi:MAG: hypothetical protein MPJ79_07320 [Alphaproteobacteria bacterium]|nr:hypothetical protein [Alphaproteobacteria bacterium]MDA7983905.1 hypothetical protein [Alphaproteobacteria bacterium]MDA7989350.1 hypothetical protein [Alphaproteobacteria bacterium]
MFRAKQLGDGALICPMFGDLRFARNIKKAALFWSTGDWRGGGAAVRPMFGEKHPGKVNVSRETIEAAAPSFVQCLATCGSRETLIFLRAAPAGISWCCSLEPLS